MKAEFHEWGGELGTRMGTAGVSHDGQGRQRAPGGEGQEEFCRQ